MDTNIKNLQDPFFLLIHEKKISVTSILVVCIFATTTPTLPTTSLPTQYFYPTPLSCRGGHRHQKS